MIPHIGDNRLYRYLATPDLRAAKEITAYDRADLATDPAAWDFPTQSAAYLALVAAAIEAELARRVRLRAHPLAPPSPEDRDDLDAIRARIDLPALIETYAPVRLSNVGRQLRCRCPLHEGQSLDDFTVNAEKGLWHCFGCLRGGDCFSFIEQWLGLDFPAAVAFLADEAGVERSHRPAPVATVVVASGAALIPVRGGGRRGGR